MRHLLSALINWAGVQDHTPGTNDDLTLGRLDRYDGKRIPSPLGRETQSHRGHAILVSLDDYAAARS